MFHFKIKFFYFIHSNNMNRIILIILALIANLLYTLNSNDFCIRHEKECKGSYDLNDNYNTICKKMNCEQHQEFNYSCGLNYCSTSKHKCDELNQNRQMLKINQEQSKSYKGFISSIRKCPLLQIDSLKSNQLCSKNHKCYIEQKMIFSTFRINHMSAIECKCNHADYSYECGETFCSLNQRKCKQFLKNKDQLKIYIRHCPNQTKKKETKVHSKLLDFI